MPSEVAMYGIQDNQPGAYLDRVVTHIEQIRQLDLSMEADLQRALDQSRQIMGTLAMYRSRLCREGAYPAHALRQAA
jgi:hypothetical protein